MLGELTLINFHDTRRDGIEAARNDADDLKNVPYGYDDAQVLSKPTLVTGKQSFRLYH